MAETAAERAAKRFEEKLKAAEERAAKAGAAGGGNDAAAKASASFDAKLRAAEQSSGGRGGKDRNLLQQIGHSAKSPLRLGGRVLTSGPVSKTLDILDRPGQAVKGGLAGAGETFSNAVGGLGAQGRGARGPAPSPGGTQRVFTNAAAGFTGKEKFTPQRVVKDWSGVDVPEGGVAGTVFGLAGDIALDPTTYLSFGAGPVAKTALRKVSAELGPEAAAAISRHGLEGAARRGLVDADEVAAAVRRATEGQKGIELAKGGVEGVVARETTKLARRGAGGMVLGGRTVIKGQGVPGRILGAPFVLPARAIAASPPAQVVRTALSTKAPIARAAGDDAAARVAEADSKRRAFADNVRWDVSQDLAKTINATRATKKELEDVLLRAAEGKTSFDLPERLRPMADKIAEHGVGTTQSGLAAEVLSAAKLHDEATYLLRMMTPAGRKKLARMPGGNPYDRLSDAQQALRQGGSVLPRTFMPDAGIQAVETELRRLHGALPRGQNYLVHNAAKLRAARATSMAEAVALSRFVDDLAGITDDAGRPILQVGDTRVQKAMSKEQEAAIRDLRAATNEAARRSERAVKAADELTSAQDLAVAARVQPPRPAPGAPSTGPILSAAGRATERALPDVERRAVSASRAAREAADASAQARATRGAIEGDVRVPAEARNIVKAAREERKALAQADLDDAVGEYERLYQGNRKIAHPPDRKLVGHDPITRRPIYARREAAQGDLWEWWDDLGLKEQQRLIRMGWVARKGERGIQPDEMAEFAHRGSTYGDEIADTGVEMQRWHAAVTKIDDLTQRARRDPVPVEKDIEEVVKRGPETIFDQPGYGFETWKADFDQVRAALRSTPKGAPGREALERQMAEMAPEGLFEVAKGHTFEDAFDIARELAAEQAAKAFTGAGKLSASEDAVRAAVSAGDPKGLTKAQRTLYDAVSKAAKGEAADTTLGAARLKAVDRITAAVGAEAEKLAAKASAAGRREGMVAGRAAGRDMAEAQLKRSRAAQTATAEGRRAQAAATRRDVLAKQVEGMEAERIVLASPAEGLTEAVQIGERTVFAIPEVAAMLKKASGIMSDDESIRGFLRFYDRVLNMGKGLATVPLFGFGFHARNFQGNLWNNYLAGVQNPAWYGRASRIQYKLRAGKPLTAREQKIMDYATEHGVFNRGSQEADLARPDALAKLGGVDAGGRIQRRLNPISDEFALVASGRTVGSAVENNARLAHFMWAMDKMGDAERASMSVKKHLFDYGDLTAFEKQGLKRFIPFWTFQRKNTPLQMAELVRQPGKFTGLAHLLAGPNEEYQLDVPPMAATKAVTAPLQPGGLASLTGLGLFGAFKSQAFGKTIPKTGTEGFQQIPAGSGSESRLDVLAADLNPLYGKYGKVSSVYRQIDEGEWLRFFLGLRRREEEPAR